MLTSLVRHGGLVRAALLLELKVAEVQDGGDNALCGIGLLRGEAHDLHGLQGQVVFLAVADVCHTKVAIAQVAVLLGLLQEELLCKKKRNVLAPM